MLKQMFNIMHSYAMNVDSFFTHNNSIQIIEASNPESPVAVVRKKQIHGQLGQPFELTQPGL